MLPFYDAALLHGDGVGVGLCTLWTPKKGFEILLPHAEVIGNLYSRFGIGILIRNVLATPRLHTLVIAGKDLSNNAHVLINHTFKSEEVGLDPAHINEFYHRTRIIDARGQSVDTLREVLLRAPLNGEDRPSYEPVIVPIPEAAIDTFPTARGAHLIRANTIKRAHIKLLQEIRQFGHKTSPDKEGHYRQELWQLTVHLSDDEPVRVDRKESRSLRADDYFEPIPLYSLFEIMHYGGELWNGNEPPETTYRYGHTMRQRYGDQIALALEILKKKHESFRPVISLWEPYGSMVRDDEPCLTTVHPRLREGVLDLFAYIRTNEMYRAWPKNAGGLRHMQLRMAEALDALPGDLTITSGSAHLYDNDLPQVDEYLGKNRVLGITFDPKGDWHLYRDGNKVAASHFSKGELVQHLVDTSVDSLAKRILPFLSDVSHALHIGRELEKLDDPEEG